MQLILGSSSPFRKSLLEKLAIPFSCVSPDIDESALPGESITALVERLAVEKAKAAANMVEGPALVIGSDQLCVVEEEVCGKPLTRDKAIAQLQRSSGKAVTFYTGLALYNSQSGRCQSLVEPFEVRFRQLSDRQIAGYVDKEEPFWCAGSFKCEGLGIALFESLNGRDPNSLVGLPLIALVRMLEAEGLDVLA
ncbi:Maf family protein [Gallaecimonas kandeliae]|uniref:Maf family protein n=1 Tax=Gallaecimonas kandeliae TaxID=3029055 RepID=UPI00264A08B6|nr:nucleoside triphosphate pyrophosphatase [Gallaecimonas kandeliae]WKE67396.1 Maf family protein [Gallaecimonas kandeliae]